MLGEASKVLVNETRVYCRKDHKKVAKGTKTDRNMGTNCKRQTHGYEFDGNF